ncbi:ribonuclease HI [Desulfotignum phosphitoxidans]|jgi:ribonuclease HI|uniref:Ribonuclease H n=2 Tax=Desulfotignum TaxID=115780 RepID=S0FR98_9BACT|nr:ribonuclease HI [Desulfotignum phosphitoxidans]EMS77195.1 ribonuclease H [Desulfotignum phosphitoxidans DSM 13687]MBG0780195.1 ribonuclease HI [Desulfotignum balticum]
MKYYAVATGRTTGIFTTWPEAKAQVEGFPGAVYKSFKTREQAEAFLADPVLGTGRKKTASSQKSRNNGPSGTDNDWPEGTIVVYTDGSAIGNPGPGGYGVVIQKHPDTPAKELSGSYGHTTNNRMEMTAVIKALQALQGTVSPVVVHSDSRYVVDALTKGWAAGWEKRGWKRSNGQPALNPDLWKQLLPLVQSLNVRFVWVRGHSGNPLNERCDELANTAARNGNPQDDTM